MKSILTQNQTKTLARQFTENGITYNLTVLLRYDDQCRNGHNTFSITGEVRQVDKRRIESCGCLHDTIVKVFPELQYLIQWHLCSSDGPMHYVANTVYHIEQHKLNFARSTAIWLDATDEELQNSNLIQKLTARLPALLAKFQETMVDLEFQY